MNAHFAKFCTCLFFADVLGLTFESKGVGCSKEQTATLVDALTESGICERACEFFCLFYACKSCNDVCHAGVWPHRVISNADIIRMMMTCTILDLEELESIHNLICKAYEFDPKKYLK